MSKKEIEIKIKKFLPIHKQIYEYLKSKIIDGEFKPLQKLPTERELAKNLSINRITLRKALRELKKEGFIFSCRSKGTFVSDIKNTLSEVINVGVLLPPLVNFNKDIDVYFSLLLRSIMNEAQNNNINLVFPERNRKTYHDIVNLYHLKGLLIIAPKKNEVKQLVKLADANLPFVIVSSTISDNRLLNRCVDADNVKGSFDLTEYLIKLGHKRIAFICGDVNEFNFADRLYGYKTALNKYNITYNPNYVVYINPNKKYDEEGYRLTKSLLKACPTPTAIFASDDNIAAGVVKALKEAHLRIPEDISVAGFDDTIAKYLEPPITSVKQPVEEIGKTGVTKLIQEYNYKTISSYIVFPTKVVHRRSCSKPKDEKL